MKKKMIPRLAILALALIFLMSMASTAAAEKKIMLKVPVCFATVLPGLGTTITYVADRIETMSGGTLRMKVYEPGQGWKALNRL